MSLLIGVPKEVFPGEKRVATVPEVVEKLIKQVVFVSATPGPYELAHSDQVVEQRSPVEVKLVRD